MAIFLGILCALFLFSSMRTFAVSKSAVHEIEALLYLLISGLFLVGAAIVRELKPMRKNAQRLMEQNIDEEADTEEDEDEEANKMAAEDNEEEPRSSRRRCPSCGRSNVASSTRCDCGWSLVRAEEEA
jgi:type VI protein secretion system component VasK